jgi:hypothetical protein
LEFDADESNVNVPASTVPEMSGGFTVEAWIYPYSYGPEATFGLGRIFDKTQISIFLNNTFPQYMDQSLVVQIQHTDGTISTSTTPATSIVLDEWQHVAVSYDGSSEVRMFINGIQMMFHQPTTPSGEIAANGASPIIIGNNFNSNKCFDGMIDEVRVWDVFKDQTEILNNMNHYLNGYESGLSHYWKLNEGTGDYIFDKTDNTMGTICDALWKQGIELEPAGLKDDPVVQNRVSLINYPNPFNPSTTISFALTTKFTEDTEISIYNLKGQKVKTFLINSSTHEPINSITWDGTDENIQPVSSGVYLCRLKNGEIQMNRKLLLLK